MTEESARTDLENRTASKASKVLSYRVAVKRLAVIVRELATTGALTPEQYLELRSIEHGAR